MLLKPTRPSPLALRLSLAAALALTGCPTPGPQPHPDGGCEFVGDPGKPLELEIIGVVSPGHAKALASGDQLPFFVPGQGGYVLYGGARARNLLPCRVIMTGELLDPDTGEATSNLDGRTANLWEQADGYWGPASADLTSELPNVSGCQDPFGKGALRSHLLHVVVQDTSGKTGSAKQLIVPSCGNDARCTCVCGPNYRPGGC